MAYHIKNTEAFWKTPPSDLPILEKEIHIWRAALDLPIPSIQKLSGTLSTDERTRAERFRFEQDRKSFIVGRGILRTILGQCLSVEPRRLRFCYGKNGKPALANTSGQEPIHFNMSRSEGLALYGLTRDQEIGVDIERIRDIPEMDQIAQRFFSVREYDDFRALPASKKKEAFFNCWTRKEAFIKAVGDGLSRPLDQFGVSLAPGEPARLLSIKGNSKETSRWAIQDLKSGSGFASAFALEGRNWRVHCWQWPH